MKALLGTLVAIVAAAPAFALPIIHLPRPPRPVPVPSPELGDSGLAVAAVIAAYALARLISARRAARISVNP